jgi:hypothetical protein
MLDLLVQNTGYHRKYVLNLLNGELPLPTLKRRRTRRKKYDDCVRKALVEVWHASNHACGKRLVVLLPSLVDSCERSGRLQLDPEVKTLLLSLSSATADRLVSFERQRFSIRQMRPENALEVFGAAHGVSGEVAIKPTCSRGKDLFWAQEFVSALFPRHSPLPAGTPAPDRERRSAVNRAFDLRGAPESAKNNQRTEDPWFGAGSFPDRRPTRATGTSCSAPAQMPGYARAEQNNTCQAKGKEGIPKWNGQVPPDSAWQERVMASACFAKTESSYKQVTAKLTAWEKHLAKAMEDASDVAQQDSWLLESLPPLFREFVVRVDYLDDSRLVRSANEDVPCPTPPKVPGA